MSSPGDTHGRAEREQCPSDRDDELAAYSLGALSETEAIAVERHLAVCERCTERLRWLEPAVAVLPASVPQVDPAPELGDRLMAIVREEAATAPAAEDRRRPEAAREGWLSRLFGGAAAMRPALVGLAAVALLFGAAGGYLVGTGGESEEAVQTVAVKPLSPRDQAQGTVTVGPAGSGSITVTNLPMLPDDEVYQVWVAHDEEVSPSSIFILDRDGVGTAAIPGVPEDADSVLITREPAGGSEVPTTSPIAQAALD